MAEMGAVTELYPSQKVQRQGRSAVVVRTRRGHRLNSAELKSISYGMFRTRQPTCTWQINDQVVKTMST